MHWNYRIVRYRNAPDQFGLHEVYYNDPGEAMSMTAEPITFVSDDHDAAVGTTPRDDIIRSLEQALQDARTLPVFDEPEEGGWAKNNPDEASEQA
jgi:hypothetical protein